MNHEKGFEARMHEKKEMCTIKKAWWCCRYFVCVIFIFYDTFTIHISSAVRYVDDAAGDEQKIQEESQKKNSL